MRTIEQKIYTYDELSEEIKIDLLEKQREAEKEAELEGFLYEDCMEVAGVLVKDYFGADAELNDVHYDFGYSQGDGGMIDFKVNFEDLNKKYNILSSEEMNFVKDKGIINEVLIHHDNNLYCHEYTFNVNYYDNFGYWDYEDVKDDYKISEDDFNKIEDKIIDLLCSYNKHQTESPFIKDIIAMNKDFTRKGYEIVEEPVEDEICLEYLKENEYYEDGEIYEG